MSRQIEAIIRFRLPDEHDKMSDAELKQFIIDVIEREAETLAEYESCSVDGLNVGAVGK